MNHFLAAAFARALQHHQAGRLREAEGLYQQILSIDPRHAMALQNLGVIAQQDGKLDLAIHWLDQALAVDPQNAAGFSNLGEVHRLAGRADEALACYRHALSLDPHLPAIYNNLGNVLRERGQYDEAIAACRRAIELQPDFADAHNNLGNAFAAQEDHSEAAACYRRAIALHPGHAQAHNNLGYALYFQRRLDDAITAFRKALELKPDYVSAHNNLGSALKDQGRIDEAVVPYRRALAIEPANAGVRSNLILALHYHAQCDQRSVAEEQARWNHFVGRPFDPVIIPHTNRRDVQKRLRIGYISPDLRDHVIGRNLVPLFRNHDRKNFEIICYSGVSRPDATTEIFRQCSDVWRVTLGMSDSQLATLIREGQIDVLVDLSQHTAGNRLPVFARRPAPVQCSFAGYPASTGLEAIGHRLSERRLEPAIESGVPLAQTGEQLYLLESFWCYDPCGTEVSVNQLPARQRGFITFGCLNSFAKVNEPQLRLWSRILQSMPNARLLLLSPEGTSRHGVVEQLRAGGVERARVEFTALRPRHEYLELYHQIDLVLDTFPYNGHTTSLDALWMGVPVVSLAGKSSVSRAGLSQLNNLGLPELVAGTEDDYVRIAVELAHDLARLAQLRGTLRSRMEASVLMDGRRFARDIEAAYRAMWRRWCLEESNG